MNLRVLTLSKHLSTIGRLFSPQSRFSLYPHPSRSTRALLSRHLLLSHKFVYSRINPSFPYSDSGYPVVKYNVFGILLNLFFSLLSTRPFSPLGTFSIILFKSTSFSLKYKEPKCLLNIFTFLLSMLETPYYHDSETSPRATIDNTL